ncbi:eukaryotic translation initiation factor 4 gamma 1-like isoform X2 [Nematostella vectensis]|uniref:eukaryotic translation initiation factor 4 gamma 1-like isoform X2 n=1 Tax=Nematostella vectensis TaxID=45351 RepID=UPI002076FE39|nr:eukaryotic translation initiation factor 4 gamma 1-like isoform X2 [Nematostella vectensis]
MQKGKGSTASPPAGVIQGRPQQPSARGPTPPQQRPEEYPQRQPHGGFQPQGVSGMPQGMMYQPQGMVPPQVPGQQPRMTAPQGYPGAFVGGRQQRPIRIPHPQQGGQPMYSSPPAGMGPQLVLGSQPFIPGNQQSPYGVSPGQVDYSQMQGPIQFRSGQPGFVTPMAYPGFAHPGPTTMQQQMQYPPPPSLFVVRPAPTQMTGNPQYQQVRMEVPKPPQQRERKLIQIRDPNQDNKDITQEIMARHGGQSAGTPSSTGSPSTTPDASGHSSNSNTPPINTNNSAEQNSVSALFAAKVAATLHNDTPPADKLKTSPQASKSTSPKISSPAQGIKLISIEKAQRTPDNSKTPVKIVEPSKTKATIPANTDVSDGAKISIVKPEACKPSPPTEVKPAATSQVSKPAEVSSLAQQAQKQVTSVQNGSTSPTPDTEEIITADTKQETEMAPPQNKISEPIPEDAVENNKTSTAPLVTPTEVDEMVKPSAVVKETKPNNVIEETVESETTVNGLESDPERLKSSQGTTVDQSVKDVPKKKKKGKQRFQEMEKRSDKADLMDAYTERPEKEVSKEPQTEQEEEEVDDTAEEHVPSEEESWEDKDGKIGIEFPESKDGKLVYDRNFLLQFQFNPICIEKPENLPDIEVVLNTMPKGPPKSFNPRMGGGGGGGGGVDFMPSYMRPTRGTPQPNPSRNKGRMQPKKIIRTIQPTVELERSENRWIRPAEKAKELPEEESKTEEVMRKFRGILNKLTPQKFKKLTEQVMELEIDTSEKLEGIIDIIFEKAISEPGFSVAYANLCRCLLPIKVSAGNKELVFRTILLNKCQKEFEKEKTDENRIHEKIDQLVNEGLSEEDYKIKKAELEEEEMFGKRRTLGNIRFIGELFKLKILTENIMHTCVMKLIKSMDEESLECFCKLLSTIGKDLDHEVAKPRMDQYFSQMDKIIASKKTSSRVRFMLQDLRDLRLSNWVPRRDDNNPKTIDQIHKEAADEEKKTQLLLQQQPKMPKNKGRDSPRTVVPQADETWTTVSSRGPRNVSVDPKKFQNVQKRNVDSENISLGPGGRGYGAWARGSSGGTGPVAATQAAQPEEPRGNRFSALGGEARRGPGAARPSSGAGRQEPRSPGPPGRWPPASEREKALEAARNLGQPKSKPERKDAPSPEPEPEEEETSAPAPEPPAAKEFSEREVEQKVNSIIDEYHNISDLKEAMECIQEMKSPSMHHKVVFYAINHSMEKHQNERLKTGRLLRALVKSNIISKEQFMEGLDEMLEFTEDYEIDIPHVYNYLGHMVGPACCDGVLPLTDISQSACKLFSKKNNCARLIAELLLTAKSESSSADVAELWAQSGINFSSFFESEDAAQQFIKKMKLESLLTSPPIAPSSSHHSANVQEELRELMLKKKASNQEVFNWIDGNVQNTKDPQFIRAIVTVVCESCKTDDGDSFKCDKVKLANRKNLLQKYIDSDSNLELQALYALQSLTEKLDHPSGFLRSYFEDFYDEDIVQEEAFYAWEKSTDPAEQTGKGTAQASTQRFFEWLRSAEEEPAKDA